MTDPKAGRKTRVLGDGRYVVRAKLGEGGMAVVYRAHDGNLDTDVVIKIPRPVLLADKEFKERFRREIRSLVTLSHPHIVKIHDVGEHNGVPFVVMQYLSGGSLEDRRKALRTMKSWLPQICSALDFIHSKGYVHRDIKPGNILFDDNGNAYLSDFGIVKAMADAERSAQHDATLTRTGMVVGTPDYMAPEVIMGEAYDGRADQYSLAVMVHEMLAGEKPFAGPTPAAVMVKHTSDPPPSLTTINPQIRESMAATIVRALAKAPDERFANCEEFWKALRSSSTGVDSGAVVPAAPSDWTESQSLTSEPTSTAHPSDAHGRVLPLTGASQHADGAMGAILGVVQSVDAALERTAGQGNEAVHKFLRGAVIAFPCLLVVMVVLLWPRTPEPLDVALKESGGATSDATSSAGSEGNAVADVSPEIGESSVDEGKAEPPPLAIAPFDAADAKQHQRAWAEYLGIPVEKASSIGMKLALIPPGEFVMGRAATDRRTSSFERPPHRVQISRAFYVGICQVTVGQFGQFVADTGYKTESEKDGKGGNRLELVGRSTRGSKPGFRYLGPKPEYTWRNPGFDQSDDHPVVNVTWNDANQFCHWIGRKEAKEYRLPTEAEWEYACRAGSTTKWHFGDDDRELAQYAWHSDNADGRTHPACSKKPNQFGLFDVHGNVREWCADWLDGGYYRVSPLRDPKGPESGKHRVLRGGCWADQPDGYSSNRYRGVPSYSCNDLGFRVVLSL